MERFFKFNPNAKWRKELKRKFIDIMIENNIRQKDECIIRLTQYYKEKSEKSKVDGVKELAILGAIFFLFGIVLLEWMNLIQFAENFN